MIDQQLIVVLCLLAVSGVVLLWHDAKRTWPRRKLQPRRRAQGIAATLLLILLLVCGTALMPHPFRKSAPAAAPHPDRLTRIGSADTLSSTVDETVDAAAPASLASDPQDVRGRTLRQVAARHATSRCRALLTATMLSLVPPSEADDRAQSYGNLPSPAAAPENSEAAPPQPRSLPGIPRRSLPPIPRRAASPGTQRPYPQAAPSDPITLLPHQVHSPSQLR